MQDFAAIDFETANSERSSVWSSVADMICPIIIMLWQM